MISLSLENCEDCHSASPIVLKLIVAELPLGLNWRKFKSHCCLCESMHNEHCRSAVTLGPAKPGKPSQNLENHAKIPPQTGL